MPRPRVLTDEQRAYLATVAAERLKAQQIPSDKVLARRMGCSPSTIKAHIRHILMANLFFESVSRESIAAHDRSAISTENPA